MRSSKASDRRGRTTVSPNTSGNNSGESVAILQAEMRDTRHKVSSLTHFKLSRDQSSQPGPISLETKDFGSVAPSIGPKSTPSNAELAKTVQNIEMNE